MNDLNIGITDILGTVNRAPSNCSSDICLTKLDYNNLICLKKYFPSLKNIFMTSGGQGPIQNLNNKNKSVATWFNDSLTSFKAVGFRKRGFIKEISIDNEVVFNLIYLYSPSNKANPALY